MLGRSLEGALILISAGEEDGFLGGADQGSLEGALILISAGEEDGFLGGADQGLA